MMRDGIVLNVLKDVKKLVENSVRSLEGIFKYNDVSNRNFGGTLSTISFVISGPHSTRFLL